MASGTDPWLPRWLPLLRACAGDEPVLEVGSAAGRDTATLVDAGLAATATDAGILVRSTRKRQERGPS